MTGFKLYLDDVRHPDPSWIIVRNPETFLQLLWQIEDQVDEISLDHDLAYFTPNGVEVTGYHVLCQIESTWCGKHPHYLIHVHSDNGPAVQKMKNCIDAMKRRSSDEQ